MILDKGNSVSLKAGQQNEKVLTGILTVSIVVIVSQCKDCMVILRLFLQEYNTTMKGIEG